MAAARAPAGLVAQAVAEARVTMEAAVQVPTRPPV
jgi:hypothetical protein